MVATRSADCTAECSAAAASEAGVVVQLAGEEDEEDDERQDDEGVADCRVEGGTSLIHRDLGRPVRV